MTHRAIKAWKTPLRWALSGAILALPLSSQGALLHVDDDAPGDPGPHDTTVSDPLEDGSRERPFDSIQEAVDTAASGDEIVLLDGTYTGIGNRDITPGGKQLYIHSLNGAASCIIDCEQTGRGFDLRSALDTITLDGLTIRGGKAISGAALRCAPGSSPLLIDCVLADNTALTIGGAIHARHSLLILRSTHLINNRARGSHGGAVYLKGGAAQIMNSVLAGNTAGATGGALFALECVLVTSGSTFSRNEAGCTGGALALGWSQAVTRNSILWDNRAGLGLGSEASAHSTSLLLEHSDVMDGQTVGLAMLSSVLGWHESCMSVDPLFVDPAAADYHLSAASPCIGAGDPTFLPAEYETDIDGNARLQGSVIDIGADEFGL